MSSLVLARLSADWRSTYRNVGMCRRIERERGLVDRARWPQDYHRPYGLVVLVNRMSRKGF